MPKIVKRKCYAETMLQKLCAQYKNEEPCDVHILAGTEKLKIPAHRNILAAASDYFKAMFSSEWNENNIWEVPISGVSSGVLRSIIEYFYTGCMEINEYNVVELLIEADMMRLNEIVKFCEEFLLEKLDPLNCINFALIAELFNCPNLLEAAKHLCLKHFEDICETDDFLNLSVDILKNILSNDNLCVWSESTVFTYAMKWIEHDLTEREQFKAKLLKLVRLPLLDEKFLNKEVKPKCTSTDCSEVYLKAWDLKFSSDCNVKYRQYPAYLMAITKNMNDKKIILQYYCPQRLKWLKCLPSIEFRIYFSVAVMSEKLYIVGGHDNRQNALNTVVCLNLNTMISSMLTPMNERRVGCGAAVLKSCLYAIGGWDLRTVEKWCPETMAWSPVAHMSVCRKNFGIAVLNDKLYVIGGSCDGSALSSAECYDPECNAWKSIKSMNDSRIGPGVVVAKGLLYAVGEWKNGVRTFEQYDPQADKWIMIRSSLSDDLYCSHSCTSFRNKITVCYENRIKEYDTERDKWVATEILNSIDTMFPLFTYTGELLTSEFHIN